MELYWGLYWDNGKENGNYYLGFRVRVVRVQDLGRGMFGHSGSMQEHVGLIEHYSREYGRVLRFSAFLGGFALGTGLQCWCKHPGNRKRDKAEKCET